MLKSLFLGFSVFILLMGLALHAIDSYTTRKRPVAATSFGLTPIEAKQVIPEPWKPWAYTGAGIVFILWTCTLPKRMGGK